MCVNFLTNDAYPYRASHPCVSAVRKEESTCTFSDRKKRAKEIFITVPDADFYKVSSIVIPKMINICDCEKYVTKDCGQHDMLRGCRSSPCLHSVPAKRKKY